MKEDDDFNLVGLSREEYDRQPDCPYQLAPELEAVPSPARPDDCPAEDGPGWNWDDPAFDPETFSRCLSWQYRPPDYNRQLKAEAEPELTATVKLKLSLSGQYLGFDLQVNWDEFELLLELEAVSQAGRQPPIAPAGARPIEEIFPELAVDREAENLRLSDVGAVAYAANEYIANNNALPANRSQLEPELDSYLSFYRLDSINAAGAWQAGSADGEFPDIGGLGQLNDVQARGGAKLAGDEADAANHLMVFRRAGCQPDGQTLAIGGIRQMAIVYKNAGGISCREI